MAYMLRLENLNDENLKYFQQKREAVFGFHLTN
ncbi:Hypothetical protein, conserved [Brucella abortus str. 2308 A]|uniref:Uncharacterized protein n=1 Tax=Brucella ceti str. Cudo TaxID=595497 RepID=C0G9B5_9HYPH|nr:hypothetical protein BRA0165 [Brucella suis 1330]AEQ09867.1 hypothetical protein BMNI_II0157 [Brucella melitensis NI]EEH13529.1 Hypothetical protein, conserved [Brucella ceti str. Cudo]EEP61703.1 Hypothetical protein, conserved [Brucella abortus str. 2308 A]EFM55124.1 Hypothetical protein BIBO1_2983 [Brucella inopinata BO1]EFM61293.1 Hypothetical protein BROD_2781 [Brucella sp. NF 2653]EPZ76781.1 hypothetical protein M798_04500 [Brucella melitensis ADMAS-G1]ERM05882.1 hypothetical protein